MPGNRDADEGGEGLYDANARVDALVEGWLRDMFPDPESPRRRPSCLHNFIRWLVKEFLTLVVKACIVCMSCCRCMLGWFTCLSCILQPFVCAWDCLRCQFGYMKAAQFVVQCACQCVQFWTPLSVTFLVLWLLYRPDRFHPYVDDAVLAALHLTHHHNASSSSSLVVQYDLSVGLSFRNSHRRLSIRYLDVGATAFYNGTKLGDAVNSLPNFRQPPKNTTVWRPAFQGVVTAFSRDVAAQLERELAAGVVHVRVGVYLTLMYKVWPVKDEVFYKYDCWLWFSPPRKDAPALFHGNGTRCWRV